MKATESTGLLNKAVICCFAASLAGLSINCGGGGDSSVAPVPTAPIITVQPSAQKAIAGGSSTFRVEAKGYPEPEVQWEKNGKEILGATKPELVLNNIPISDDGATYDAIVHNLMGNVTSSPVVLNVQPPAGSYVVKFKCAPKAGAVSGETIQLVASGGETKPVVAIVPVRGWSFFKDWTCSDGSSVTTPTLVATNVTTDATWQANFKGSNIGCEGDDIPGIDVNGSAVNMSDFKGKVILLNVSAIGMSFGTAEKSAPLAEAFFQKYKGQGLAAVTVLAQTSTYSIPTASDLQTWVSAYGLTSRVQNDTSSSYPLTSISELRYWSNPSAYNWPTFVVLDKNFTVQYIAAGFDEAALTAIVESLLAK